MSNPSVAQSAADVSGAFAPRAGEISADIYQESLGRPVGQDRLNVGLALLATQWLGAAVLRQAGAARS